MLRLHWASKVHGFQMTVFTHPPVNDLRFLRSMDCVDGNFIVRLPPFLQNTKILKQLVFEISLHCNKDPAPCITFFTVGMEWMYSTGPSRTRTYWRNSSSIMPPFLMPGSFEGSAVS